VEQDAIEEEPKNNGNLVFTPVLITNGSKTVDGGFSVTLDIGAQDRKQWATLMSNLGQYTVVFIPRT